jgi:hypothetical protein
MKYIRIIFLIQTILWTFGAVAALWDAQVTSHEARLAVLITATACWGVIASWSYIWKSVPPAVAGGDIERNK